MKIKELQFNARLVKLPPDVELPLFLITEELKGRKLFNGLAKLGFDDSKYAFNLSKVIFAVMGFTETPDYLYTWYFNALDKYSEKIEPEDTEGFTKAAFKIYIGLKMEKRKRLAK